MHDQTLLQGQVYKTVLKILDEHAENMFVAFRKQTALGKRKKLFVDSLVDI